MQVVLIAGYFVVLAWAVLASVLLVRLNRDYKAQQVAHKNGNDATKAWAQRMQQNHDRQLKHVEVEAFQKGRRDMLTEFKERVDRGELSVQVLTTPVTPPAAPPTQIPVR